MSASAAAGTRVNGINGMSMTLMAQAGPTILEPNTQEFTHLAAAINTGIKIIESPAGQRAFIASGQDVVAKWTKDRTTQFWGNPALMNQYLAVFVQKLRENFPRVVIQPLSSPDEVAQYRRMPGQLANFGGVINNYNPKNAGGIYFNASRVNGLVRAAAGTDKKHKERYLNFHFLFAAATAHELMHAFVGLLAGASDTPHRYTPPETTHLNYGEPARPGNPGNGESGRYMEKLLFGGSLEWYRDPKDDNEQCGIVHRLDERAVAKKLSPASCWKIVRHEDFTFPIATEGADITPQQRQQLNLRSLGSIHPHPMAMAGPSASMKARKEIWYNLSATELKEVVTKSRKALSVLPVRVGA